jgi:alkylation response protein AidB-like acyl-CoA dehydrogenase
MDFSIQYTKEQETFRMEVRTWMQENAKVPENLGPIPLESGAISREMWEWGKEFRRKLGAKGWLFALWDKEYGGGGYTAEQNFVIQEELERIDVPRIYSNNFAMPALHVYGTEEQKQRFLAPLCSGELICWQGFTEPEGGSDLASLKTKAVKDGDDFIITGQKMWIGGQFETDYIWTPAVTDPDAPRHQNLGAFMIPADLPGITFHELNLMVEDRKRLVSFDGVRVPREYLIGEETQGWRVISASLEIEHGAAGAVMESDTLLEEIIQYCKETDRNGSPMSEDPFVQQGLAENYIESTKLRLIGLRNYHMFNSGQTATYHGSQNSFLGKHYNVTKAQRILEALGPYAMTNDEKWAVLNGRVEVNQRSSLVGLHPGGTYDVQKLIMARRLGISRTQERAAPTQARTQAS